MTRTRECNHTLEVLAHLEVKDHDDGERVANEKELEAALAHIDGCEDCRKDPDISDAFHRITNDPANLHNVDQLLAEQEADERPKAEAVRGLLDSLSGAASKLGTDLAHRHGWYSLYAAQEAVSSTIRRRARRRRPERGIELVKGECTILFDGVRVFVRDDLALEIARFADLWTDDEVGPDPDTSKYVDWISLVLSQQSRLLHDFAAYDAGHQFWLRALPANERVEDPYRRWSSHQSEQLVSLATNGKDVFLVNVPTMERHGDLSFVTVATDPKTADAMFEAAGDEVTVGPFTLRRLPMPGGLRFNGDVVEITLHKHDHHALQKVVSGPHPDRRLDG